jgi:hypothetical protein
MERLTGAMDLSEVHIEEFSDEAGEDDEDDDAPTSEAEAKADAEQARMDLLLDRVLARIARAREAGEKPDHTRIMEEERDRLRRERGEPEPEPLSPEEQAERDSWIDEANAAGAEALEAAKAEAWMDDNKDEPREHPLVVRCTALFSRLSTDCEEREWLTAFEPQEHPLRELVNGVLIASGKLAGALKRMDDADWPPEALFAGGVLVRLKKARGYLRDALAGADDAAERDIAERVWLAVARAEVVKLIAEVETLIAEVRAVLEAAGDTEADDE